MLAANLRPLVGWLLVGLLALGVALAASPGQAQDDESLDDPVTFAVESYAQVCARCHGVNGAGGEVPTDGRPVPALVDNPDLSVAYLDLVMLTGRMPPSGDPFDNREREVFYTDAERAAMVAWMAEEFGIEGEIPEVGPGEVSRGLEVFARNCAHCHGNAGGGGTAGQQAWTPQVASLPGLAIKEAIRVGPFEMPAFGPDVISEEDADAVVAYLEEVDGESGTPLLGLVELNPVFASGFVGVLALALIGSLLYIGSRPVPLEQVVSDSVDADPIGRKAQAAARAEAADPDEAAVPDDAAAPDEADRAEPDQTDEGTDPAAEDRDA